MSPILCDVLPAYDNSGYRVDELNHYIGSLRQTIEELQLKLLAAEKDAESARDYRRCCQHRDDVFEYVVDQAFDGEKQVQFTVDGGCADEDFVPGWYNKNGRRIRLVSAVYEVCEVA